jgi:hypothetical protein
MAQSAVGLVEELSALKGVRPAAAASKRHDGVEQPPVWLKGWVPPWWGRIRSERKMAGHFVMTTGSSEARLGLSGGVGKCWGRQRVGRR